MKRVIQRFGLEPVLAVCWALILASTVSLAYACASKNMTPATPKAAVAMKSDAVLTRVMELEKSVIEACGPAPQCQPNSLDTNVARAVVQGCIDIAAVLKASADGWQASVKAIWAQVKPKFVGVTNPAILSAFGLVDALLGAL